MVGVKKAKKTLKGHEVICVFLKEVPRRLNLIKAPRDHFLPKRVNWAKIGGEGEI